MNQFLLVLAVALTVGAIVFGIIALITGDDQGLPRAEPDGRAVPLPADRPLVETDIAQVRFDTALRGYRMAQVDAALRRAAYDIGYKDELVRVLQAEIDALREGRFPDAEVLRRAREAAAGKATETATAHGSGQTTTAAGETEPAVVEQVERSEQVEQVERSEQVEQVEGDTADVAGTGGTAGTAAEIASAGEVIDADTNDAETAASDGETTIFTGRR